jgi:hypothetical protein
MLQTIVVDEKSNIINVRKPGGKSRRNPALRCGVTHCVCALAGASLSMESFTECVRVTRQRREVVSDLLTPLAR